MIQVRDVLNVKFGKIDQAVELFTKTSGPAPIWAPSSGPTPSGGPVAHHFDLLTDVSGEMYTLIYEFVVDNLGQFEAIRNDQYTQPEFEEWFERFQLHVEGGRREFFNVEGAYEAWTRPGVVVVRECYRAYKWQIRTAVELLRRYGGLLADRGVGQRPRILTDASGPMFQAIIEIETESLSTWESQRRSLFNQTEFQVWFTQLRNTVEAGRHDFYRVEYISE